MRSLFTYFVVVVTFLALFSACKKDDHPVSITGHSVTAMVPDSGYKQTEVLIRGNGFGSNAADIAVYFNGVAATVLTVADTAIKVKVPQGAGSGYITVGKNNVFVSGPFFRFFYTVSVAAFSGTTQGFTNGAAGIAQFSRPRGLASDSSGNLFVADEGNHSIRVIYPNGTVNTFVGSGIAGAADGVGGGAQFNHPYDIKIDEVNHLFFVADYENHLIRKISISGTVNTVAGIAGTPGYVDGAATAARLNHPSGIALLGEDVEVFIADQDNHCIRQLNKFGILNTWSGANSAGNQDGSLSGARYNAPFGIYADTDQNLYVTDSGNHNVRKISVAGLVTTTAGTGFPGFNNHIPLLSAFDTPQAVVAYKDLLIICDTQNHAIRMLQYGRVITLAGNGMPGMMNGAGDQAMFNSPGGIVRSTDGAFYISDTENHMIRKMVLD